MRSDIFLNFFFSNKLRELELEPEQEPELDIWTSWSRSRAKIERLHNTAQDQGVRNMVG